MRSLSRFVAISAFCLGFGGSGIAAAADAPKDVSEAAKEDAKCTKCHDESEVKPVLSIYQTRHGVKADQRTPTCKSCHGASEEHQRTARRAGTPALPDVAFGKHAKDIAGQITVCLACHEGGIRTLWQGSRHESEDMVCSSCHSVHTPRDRVVTRTAQPDTCFACHKTERAQVHRISTHPIAAGKVVCSDCHNPHGSTGPKLLIKNSTNETCWTCHAEKRGPFLWEHPSAMDDCLNCHTPHGSTNPPLLRARAPWLCQECHGDTAPHPGNVYSASSLPGGAVGNVNATGGVASGAQLHVINPITGMPITQNNPPSQMAFKACLNCHQNVHGSNHPGGNRFLR